MFVCLFVLQNVFNESGLPGTNVVHFCIGHTSEFRCLKGYLTMYIGTIMYENSHQPHLENFIHQLN